MLVDISTVTGAIMAVIVFIGSVGNLLTLFVIIRYRPLHDVTGMFLANLAVADLLQSTFGMPLIATSAFQKKWIFGDALCTISGATNSLFCITSMLTLSAISVDRWLAIVYPLHHNTLLTIPRARVVLIYIWAHALLVALFPAFGWSRYVYLSYEFICTVQWEYNKAYTIFLSVTSFAVPLLVTVASYSGVMKVACHRVRETPLVKIGEIVAEQDLVISHNGINDSAGFPGLRNGTKQMKRVDFRQQTVSDNYKVNEQCYLNKRPRKDNSVLAAKAEVKANLDSKKHKQKKLRFNFSEEAVTASKSRKLQTTADRNVTESTEELKNWTEADFEPENSLERSAKRAARTSNKIGTARRSSTKIKENNNTPAKKRLFLFLGKRKDVIDPIYPLTISRKDPELSRMNADLCTEEPELSSINSRLYYTNPDLSGTYTDLCRVSENVFHEDPELYRLKRAWKSEDLFGSELGVIPEEDETRDSQQGMESLSNRTKSHGHLARMREWMAVRLMNKERADAVLHRKKEMKVVLTLAVVNGTFVLCWLPHFIGILCLTFTNGSCPFSDSFFVITTILAMLNSGCNPFIYTLTYRKFRKAFRRLVFPWFRSNRTRNLDSPVN